MQSFVPRDAFALKIQRELSNLKCARKVSGLSRNGPQLTVNYRSRGTGLGISKNDSWWSLRGFDVGYLAPWALVRAHSE